MATPAVLHVSVKKKIAPGNCLPRQPEIPGSHRPQRNQELVAGLGCRQLPLNLHFARPMFAGERYAPSEGRLMHAGNRRHALSSAVR